MLDVLIRSYNTVDTVLYPLYAGRRDAARRSRKTWGRLIDRYIFFFPEYNIHSTEEGTSGGIMVFIIDTAFFSLIYSICEVKIP